MATETTQGVREWGNYIGGEWVTAADGATIAVYNPCTEELIATVPSMSREEAADAIAAARVIHDSGVWSEAAPDERSRIMLQVAAQLADHEDELAELEAMESGMTIRAASTVQLGQSCLHWDYFARQADRQFQEALAPVGLPDPLLQLRPARADRRLRGHRPLELPPPDGGLEARPRPGHG